MSERPLASLKVLDFSTLLPGPYATQLMADMGATVLRIESPTRPDIVTSLPPVLGKVSAAHHTLNRNKKSLALELKQPEAIAIVERLIQQYDILVEQFRPGVMDRLGLGYVRLKALNPRLIYCSITGYGQNGPYRDRAGHDINYLALSGIASQSCNSDGEPMLAGTQWADLAGGSHHAVMGILAAEVQRRETGAGQHLDISMSDAAFALNGLAGAATLASSKQAEPGTSWCDGGSFYGYYRTRDQRYLSIAGIEPVFVGRLAELLSEPALAGLQELHDPVVQQQLKNILRERIAQRDYREWQDIFAATDCCVEPVLSITEAAEHPQLQAREMIIQCEIANEQWLKQVACPIKFSDSQQQAPKSAADTGEHSLEVMRQLGYEKQEIEQLLSSGALASPGEY